MKTFISLVLLVVLVSCSSLGQSTSHDMLDWMTMDASFGAHTTGNSTSMWMTTDTANSHLYWIKGTNGYPWDVKSWDANFIYDSITEVSWTDPHTYKKHRGSSNGLGYPLMPRFLSWDPTAQSSKLNNINIPQSNTDFEIHTSCSAYTLHNLGYARTEVWGPFLVSLGGNLPTLLPAVKLNWLWGCNSSYGSCSTKEVFTLAQAYGNVRWQNYKLQNGVYVLQQDSIRNQVVPGTIAAVHPCWK